MSAQHNAALNYPRVGSFIDGELIETGDGPKIKVVDPSSHETIATLSSMQPKDLDRALRASALSFADWRRSPPQKRADVLHGAAALLRDRIDHIASVATLEQGKPLREATIEVQKAAELFDFYAGEVYRKYGRALVRPVGQRATVVKEPIGPVAAFSPWNFPIVNPARKLGGAVAGGCSVILKPAEETPGSALAILNALVDAGLPPAVAQIVFGTPDEISSHLLASPIVRKLSFTGSTAVGKILLERAARTVKRATVELGGHAPVIVFDDADIEQAVAVLVASKFRNAGQVCVSPTRFYVQEKIYDRFVDAFCVKAGQVVIGSGFAPETGMGPLAHDRRPPALDGFVNDAVAEGAELLLGGGRPSTPGNFWQPTVLAGVTHKARIMNEEPFGPVAAIARFTHMDEAVEAANRLPFGLAGYAFTRDLQRANTLGDVLEVGMVGINTTQIASADAPFQGVKESGYGSEEGIEGMEAYLQTKTIHQG